MEIAWKSNSQFLSDRRRVRLLVRVFIGISTLVGFLMFYDMHSYMPWHLKTLKALARTFEVHLGLWLATLEMQSRWRFLVALLLIPSGVGAYFFWWHRNVFTLIAALIGISWLLYIVLRGKKGAA